MDKRSFYEKHRNRITLGAFDDSRFVLRRDVIVSEEEYPLSKIVDSYAPWYYRIDEQGSMVTIGYGDALGDAKAQAVRLIDIEVIRKLYPKRIERAEKYRQEMNDADAPREPLILAEDTSSGLRFTLDGNHTTIALQLKGHQKNSKPIPTIVIRGPNLSEILGDMVIINRRNIL